MCATSIGSTLAHRPVPGVRKSGMPDGTEMPAPVSATTERAPRISSTRRAASVVTDGATVTTRSIAACASRGRR